ncbi:U2 snRNP-associated SURP motif-containing protein-like [Orbicella faveolata]|uniref:U2 snRNP-associated SURP motif-containing protein-like n=2 Tax=Orbicella faveolata TaxID=48498 RepID=UPI0009E4B516|nr:U2 snRNP-associated SURP motif-containing protein-like [Orbicella faveolata]
MAAKKLDPDKSLPWGLSPEGLAPGSMKTISQSKLKSFSIGMMNAGLKKPVKSKQDAEEKKKKAESECAEVFADFVASFEDSRVAGKTFVRGNTINPETKEETASAQAGALYKPMAKLSATVMEQKIKTELAPPKLELKKKAKEKEKKKSNLEIFKEELKRQQKEREIRHRIKKGDLADIPKEVLETMAPSLLMPSKEESYSYGSHDTGDPSTTNLYIGNINPTMTEEMLMRLFGKYGPLASVKIMWPRTEEEKARNRNCGFVAYMRRKDGEKALNALKGKEVMSYEMKLGWGKSVPIPPHPIYIPPEMQEDTTPPPPSGLPFNAQTDKKKDDYSNAPPPQGAGEEGKRDVDANGFDKETLANAVVKVVIPTERNLLCLVHRMVEFVVREGPMFEAMIMNKELNNPMYRFLFDNQSPEHIYYRWKLFSILQGDSPTKWRTEKFKMFQNGSVWRPPQCHQYTMSAAAFNANKQPVPQVETPLAPPSQPTTTSAPSSHSSSGSSSSSSVTQSSTAASSRKASLSNKQRDKLEDMLRDLMPERAKIARCMVFCVNHADCAEEVVECIAESLSILETPLQVKVARLYLVSDILHNCSVKVPNVSYYRKGFQTMLPEIFGNLSASFKAINARMKAETFRKQVLRCVAAWMDWAVYTPDFLYDLQNIFLGQGEKSNQSEVADQPLKSLYPLDGSFGSTKDDLDGAPLDVDGVPIKSKDMDGVPLKQIDIDGVPLSGDDIDGMPMDNKKTPDKSRDKDVPHVASKWDQPDWERIEEREPSPKPPVKEDSPNRPEEQPSASVETPRTMEIDESRRRKLREIELKVAEYAQKLEAKGASNLAQQCDVYRAKLLEAIEPKESKEKKKKGSSHTNSPSESRRKKSRSRSKSPSSKKRGRRSQSSESRSPSRSPARSRSRSPLTTSLQSLKHYESRTPSPSNSRRSRSRSRSSSRGRGRSRSRSRSPVGKQRRKRSRSRSGTPAKKSSSRKKRSRSRSRSPSRKKSKKKKK